MPRFDLARRALADSDGRIPARLAKVATPPRNNYPPAREYFTLAGMSPDGAVQPFVGKGLLSSGVEIDCALRTVEHPEGRFRRADGTRYDLCVLEVLADPGFRSPTVSRAEFVGDCADNLPVVIRLGNVRQSSFRLRLISPGGALGTLAAAAKSSATVPARLQ